MEVFSLVGKITLQGKEQLTSDLKQVIAQGKETQTTFRQIQRVTQPMGMALVTVGAAGLALTDSIGKWNKGLGDFMKTLRPVFIAMTAFGGLLLTVPRIIYGIVTAVNVLKIALISLRTAAFATQAAFAGLTLGLSLIVSGIVMLATHKRSVVEITAETERWGETLGKTNKRLNELKLAGQGASDEAQNLRKVMDDLIKTYDVYNTIGDDNVVTTYNLADAEKKLAEAKELLPILEDQLIGRRTAANKATAIGIQQTENLEASIGNYKNTIVELTLGILDLKDAQDQETQALRDNADTIRDDAISALEKLYGLQANETKSLMDQFQDETQARQAELNGQLDAVRSNTNDVIKQYQREYDTRVKLLQDETDAQVKALQDQLDLLKDSQKAADQNAEDVADTKTEAELRTAVDQAWNRKDRANAEAALAKFLEDKAKKLADRQRQDARDSLQKQITDVQTATDEKKAQWQEELDANIENQNAILAASEITIQSELDSLQAALVTKREILQQQLNDAVTVQNQIRDNAIAAINAEVQAQLTAASIPVAPITFGGGATGSARNASLHALGVPGYAGGGPIIEPTALYGLRSKEVYAVAHQGERVTPAGGGGISGGSGGITITGNTFNVRSDADIPRIASELLRQRMLKGSFGS